VIDRGVGGCLDHPEDDAHERGPPLHHDVASITDLAGLARLSRLVRLRA
jgi:hypothetical protein